MKTLIAAILMGCLSTSYAMRCGSELIEVGSRFDQVMSLCNPVGVYKDQTNHADSGYVIVKQDGMTYTISIIDGFVTDIQESRE